MSDLRDDPVFLRRFATVAVQEAVRRSTDGNPEFEAFVSTMADKARDQTIALAEAAPAQRDFFS